MKILFVRGYNTNLESGVDEYIYIKLFFENNNLKFDYFNYSPNENINDVYKRLCDVIKNNNYNTLIGHSMGGGLLMKYIDEHNVKKFHKIILLMPLIYKQFLNNLISKIPFVQYLYLIKAFFIPANNIYNKGNILNDSYNFISLQQPVLMYKDIMLSNKKIIKNLNKNTNCVLFYAQDEKLNNINQTILDKIKNKVYVNGKHECFNEFENTYEFFKKFKKYLL